MTSYFILSILSYLLLIVEESRKSKPSTTEDVSITAVEPRRSSRPHRGKSALELLGYTPGRKRNVTIKTEPPSDDENTCSSQVSPGTKNITKQRISSKYKQL